MFDIAWSEILLIAVVALIFIGPKELPQVLHGLGRAAAKLRRQADEFRRHFEDSMRESGYEDLHKNLQDFRALNPATQLREGIERAINQDYHAPAEPRPTESVPLPSAEAVAPESPQQTPESREHSVTEAVPQDAQHQSVAPDKPMHEPSKDHAAPAV